VIVPNLERAALHWDVARTAFQFVQDEVLPQIDGFVQDTAVRFQLFQSDTFEAYVSPPQSGGAYEVCLHSGLLDELYAMLAGVGDQTADRLCQQRMDRFGLRGRRRLLTLTYLYAVLWICLHETAHVLGGHVDLWCSSPRSRGSGVAGLSETEAGADTDDFCRVRELEADGYGVELLHDWRFAAAAMFIEETSAWRAMEAGAVHPRHKQKIGRVLLFAALCCGLLLEKHRPSFTGTGTERSGYPFPEARMANMAARYVLSACASTFRTKVVARDGSLYLSRTFSEAEALLVAETLITEVLPPLAWAQDLADHNGIRLHLFDRNRDQLVSETGLWRDIRALVTGLPATSTVGGRELMRVSGAADAFHAAAAPHRRSRWGSG
jgi:hypothetical protein